MRIAIPIYEGKLATHFGHCESFALIDADPERKEIVGRRDVEAPPHQPGLLPAWLSEQGVSTVIAGGMGQRAQQLFTSRGICVVTGAPALEPERVVKDYLAGTLQAGENPCDH